MKRNTAFLAAAVLSACGTDEPELSTATTELSSEVTFVDKRGVARTVLLDGPAIAKADNERSAAMAKDRTNNLGIYRDLFEVVEGTRFQRELRLPAPRDLETAEVPAIRALIESIVRRGPEIRRELFPEDLIRVAEPMSVNVDFDPTPCVGGYEAEQGNGTSGDMATVGLGENCGLSKSGPFYNDPRPYRNHLSCIRDQANRGTCGSFAIASTLEAAHAKTVGTKINLSEQMIYFHSEGMSNNVDGTQSGATLDKFFANAIELPLENVWNYNPSWSRTWDMNGMLIDSCVDYPETCSDTARQGKIVPQRGGGFTLEAPAYDTGVVIGEKSWDIWDDDDVELSILLMKATLFTGNQLNMGFRVTTAITAAASSDGFVTSDGVLSSSSHAVHVVSYIDNEDLAIIAPTVAAGDGGGYFIIRNSWGPCTGDGGYLYFPYSWMKAKFINRAHKLSSDAVVPM